MPYRKEAHVVFPPDTSPRLRAGIATMVSAIQPTLGPVPRLTAVERGVRNVPPELIDNGGVIARRITELPDRDENVGAMLVRSLLWGLYEDTGDGTATAVVIFESIYSGSLRAIAAGIDQNELRQHLKSLGSCVTDALAKQTTFATGEQPLVRMAESTGADRELASVLGEIFNVIGEHGTLEIRNGYDRKLRHTFVDGQHWKSQMFSSSMISDPVHAQTLMERPVIVMTDLEIVNAEDLVPLLVLARGFAPRPLVLFARQISKPALTLLNANNDPVRHPVVAMKTPGATDDDRRDAFDDLVHLVGGRALRLASGDSLSNLTPEDFGHAQRGWTTAEAFGIVGGKGDARALRDHVAALQRVSEHADRTDATRRIDDRIDRFLGGSATLWVGAHSDTERKVRQAQAERTARVLRGMMRDGVVPGGGTALLACRQMMPMKCEQSHNLAHQTARQLVNTALEVPMRTILANCGADVDRVIARIETAGPGHGFDARGEQIVNMSDAGILDASHVLREAVGRAIDTAALALTVDVLLHSKRS